MILYIINSNKNSMTFPFQNKVLPLIQAIINKKWLISEKLLKANPLRSHLRSLHLFQIMLSRRLGLNNLMLLKAPY